MHFFLLISNKNMHFSRTSSFSPHDKQYMKIHLTNERQEFEIDQKKQCFVFFDVKQ